MKLLFHVSVAIVCIVRVVSPVTGAVSLPLPPRDPNSAAKTLNAFDRIQGEDFNYTIIGYAGDECGTKAAVHLDNGAILVYYDVDFGEGADVISFRFSNGDAPSNSPFLLNFYLDNPLTTVAFATISVQRTGGWCNFIEWKSFVTNIPTGVHDLYLLFSCYPSDSGVGIMNLDWFAFENLLEDV